MNGWTNYQTWAAVTWGADSLEDDEYMFAIGRSTDKGARILKLSEYLRERFDTMLELEYPKTDTLIYDILTEACERINWYEVAAGIVAERGEEEDTESVD